MPPKTPTSPPLPPVSRSPRPQHSPSRNAAQYVPQQPSHLRTSHIPGGDSVSPEESSFGDRLVASPEQEAEDKMAAQRPKSPRPSRSARQQEGGKNGSSSNNNSPASRAHSSSTQISPSLDPLPDSSIRPRLNTLDWDAASCCGSEAACAHGALSPRAMTLQSQRSYGSFDSRYEAGFGGRYADSIAEDGSAEEEAPDVAHALLGDSIADGLLRTRGANGRMSTTKWLAKKYGIRGDRAMYLQYYVPLFNWIRQYRWSYVFGDLIAAITMASFYIPMALSYASNLGHVPPVQGLYAFVFNPLIYAMLGTCPQMVVGPEAAGSLLTGQVVRENINSGNLDEGDLTENAHIAGMVTFMAGAVILIAGIFRLGFLDNVLSKPFLRGFISAIGIVIFIDQLVPELGLDKRASEVGVAHGSTLEKAIFICENIAHTHRYTAAVSLSSFGIIMVCREVKRRLQPRYPNVAYVPDRFIIVVLSAVFAWRFRWDEHGVEILGDITEKGHSFTVHFPLGTLRHLRYASDAFSTSFAIALLGFFESSVAAKSLGNGEEKGGVLKNVNLSANRELMALGVANVVGGLWMSMPAFGGYGRSKVNKSTGGKTPMSSVFLAIISAICILFLLPYFYYIPKGVLNAMISVVALSLLEEIPPDLLFFVKIRDLSSLSLMSLIFFATIFWNLKIGIAAGIGLSLLRVIRHSTRPRIQILGRVPGTTDKFENAERIPGGVEFLKGVLIVKIPEPLTFANTGDLKARLRRLEHHGTGSAHPALPPVRAKEHNKNVIFDVHGVTGLDGAGAQVLLEIVTNYVREQGVRVFFCRVPSQRSKIWRLMVRSGIVEVCGGEGHFVREVEEALRLCEVEELGDEAGAVGREGRVV